MVVKVVREIAQARAGWIMMGNDVKYMAASSESE